MLKAVISFICWYALFIVQKMKILFGILIVLVVLLLVADLIYSRIVLARWAKWEKTVERNADGVRLHCAPFSMGEGGVAILMVHGFADSPSLYRRYAPVLAERGYHCKAIRLPGWAVALDEMRQVELDDWRAKIEEEVNTLRASYDRVWVVSHSLGAALSLNLASDNKLGADGLVAITPMIKVADHRSPVLTSAQWFKVSSAALNFSRTVESIFPVDMHDESMVDQMYRDTFVPRNIYEALFELMRDLRGRAGDITLPLLMILSDDDMIVDSEAAERFYKRVGAADKKLVTVEGSGHVVPLDHAWEATVDIIDQYIQSEEEAARGSE